jgi:uncharacterized RmlC-like cupin family protein
MSGAVRVIRGDDLSGGTAQTSGMHRSAAISGEIVGARALWMGRTVVLPGASSGDHHHGDSETAIYVVSGTPAFVFRDPATGEVVRVETRPGDYVWVPPHVPHREENPSPDTEAVVVIARSTQEAIVVNVPALLLARGGRPGQGPPHGLRAAGCDARRDQRVHRLQVRWPEPGHHGDERAVSAAPRARRAGARA